MYTVLRLQGRALSQSAHLGSVGMYSHRVGLYHRALTWGQWACILCYGHRVGPYHRALTWGQWACILCYGHRVGPYHRALTWGQLACILCYGHRVEYSPGVVGHVYYVMVTG